MNTSAEKKNKRASVTQGHYHQVRFSGDDRLLWNPAARQLLANRPEERVRLRCMEWLHFRCGIPYSRMSTELPLKQQFSGETRRADILATDRQLNPWLLIECKSEDVQVNAAAAHQAARYNESIRSPYLMLSNGRTDAAFNLNTGKPVATDTREFEKQEDPPPDAFYWTARGFTGKKTPEDSGLYELAFELFKKNTSAVQYVNVNLPQHPFPFSHYYVSADDSLFTLSGHPDGSTWLVALRSSGGKSPAIILIPLHHEGHKPLLIRLTDRFELPAKISAETLEILESKPDIPAINTFLSGLD